MVKGRVYAANGRTISMLETLKLDAQWGTPLSAKKKSMYRDCTKGVRALGFCKASEKLEVEDVTGSLVAVILFFCQ